MAHQHNQSSKPPDDDATIPLPCYGRGLPLIPLEELPLFKFLKRQVTEHGLPVSKLLESPPAQDSGASSDESSDVKDKKDVGIFSHSLKRQVPSPHRNSGLEPMQPLQEGSEVQCGPSTSQPPASKSLHSADRTRHTPHTSGPSTSRHHQTDRPTRRSRQLSPSTLQQRHSVSPGKGSSKEPSESVSSDDSIHYSLSSMSLESTTDLMYETAADVTPENCSAVPEPAETASPESLEAKHSSQALSAESVYNNIVSSTTGTATGLTPESSPPGPKRIKTDILASTSKVLETKHTSRAVNAESIHNSSISSRAETCAQETLLSSTTACNTAETDSQAATSMTLEIRGLPKGITVESLYKAVSSFTPVHNVCVTVGDEVHANITLTKHCNVAWLKKCLREALALEESGGPSTGGTPAAAVEEKPMEAEESEEPKKDETSSEDEIRRDPAFLLHVVGNLPGVYPESEIVRTAVRELAQGARAKKKESGGPSTGGTPAAAVEEKPMEAEESEEPKKDETSSEDEIRRDPAFLLHVVGNLPGVYPESEIVRTAVRELAQGARAKKKESGGPSTGGTPAAAVEEKPMEAEESEEPKKDETSSEDEIRRHPAFLLHVVGNLPGVDPESEIVRTAVGELAQGARAKKESGGPSTWGTPAAAVEEKPMEAEESEEPKKDETSSEDEIRRDPAFLLHVVGNLPGVDPESEIVRTAVGELAQGARAKKKESGGPSTGGTPAAAVEEKPMEAEESEEPKKDETSSEDEIRRDPALLPHVIGNLPGVDPESEIVRTAVRELAQEARAKKESGGPSTGGTPAAAVEEKPMEAEESEEPKKDETSSEDEIRRDPALLPHVIGNLPGVDPESEIVRTAVRELAQGARAKKESGGPSTGGTPAAAVEEKPMEAEESEEPKKDETSSEDEIRRDPALLPHVVGNLPGVDPESEIVRTAVGELAQGARAKKKELGGPSTGGTPAAAVKEKPMEAEESEEPKKDETSSEDEIRRDPALLPHVIGNLPGVYPESEIVRTAVRELAQGARAKKESGGPSTGGTPAAAVEEKPMEAEESEEPKKDETSSEDEIRRDPAFLLHVVGNLPGVDSQSEIVHTAVRELTQGARAKKGAQDKGKSSKDKQ